jgi:subtilase family serine protease
VIIPESAVEHPGDKGVRAHTPLRIFVPASAPIPPSAADGGTPAPLPSFSPAGAAPQSGGPPFPGFFFETPASIACIYGLVAKIGGCNPTTVTANPTGGSKTIAIVDAFDDPDAASDLAAFSTQFGLSAPTFSVVYATGTEPATDPTGGWEVEESLDIEWAHAMAPGAKIILVEAASESFTDLMTAENVASGLVAGDGGGEVSNSWGGSEFADETILDEAFTTPGIVYFASSGDGGIGWPGSSPNVVSAGGTTTARNPSTGNFLHELSWDSAGSGLSSFELRPSYQNAIKAIVGSARGIPDLSADSNPNTGVWVFDSAGGGWFVVGGTSVATPMLAGIVNSAGHFATSSAAELATIYANRAVAADFNDLKLGYCGPYSGYSATKGWDFCTGVGSDKGEKGK